MTLRMPQNDECCSMLPIRMLGAHQERFRIAPLDMEIDLPNRNIGFWTTALARNRLEVVHFFGKLETYLSKAGLRP